MPGSAKIDPKNIKVLIVEDDDTLRNMYITKLQMSGFMVKGARNGTDGLHVVADEKPDLVLLDILMPGISGFDVLKQIKQHKDASIKNIPVVLLTNLSEDAGHKQGVELGADAYAMKVNYTPEQLVQLVQAVVKTSHSKAG